MLGVFIKFIPAWVQDGEIRPVQPLEHLDKAGSVYSQAQRGVGNMVFIIWTSAILNM